MSKRTQPDGTTYDVDDGIQPAPGTTMRERIEALHLIEPNEPDHPGPYYDGWHAALDTVEALVTRWSR